MQERITQNTGKMSREGKILRQAAVFTKQGAEMLRYIRNRVDSIEMKRVVFQHEYMDGAMLLAY